MSTEMTERIMAAAQSALPAIQARYDRHHDKSGEGICYGIWLALEAALKQVDGLIVSFYSQRDHCCAQLEWRDGLALLDIPWKLYERPDGDPAKGMCNWTKLPDITFTADFIHFDRIV